MGEIVAVCISEIKGIQKKNIHSAKFIEDFGIENDAHAGKWHRQVSFLSWESREKFKHLIKDFELPDGAFGENLLVKGIDFKQIKIGTKLKCNEVILELTQIGKECHKGCAIRDIVGDCIMPREGVFARVLAGGIISEGDIIEII
mgnify:CR=1 FL=1